MKSLSTNFTLVLFTLITLLSSCEKKEVEPNQPGATSASNDGVTAATTFKVKAFLFLRRPGPFKLGHTGVGYEVREMNGNTLVRSYTYCGGVENPGGSPVVPQNAFNGGWYVQSTNGTAMLRTMGMVYGYTAYKYEAGFRPISTTRLNNALNFMRAMSSRGYNVTGNNCMNAGYDVLNALNCPGVSWPSTNWFPRDQFANTTNGWSREQRL